MQYLIQKDHFLFTLVNHLPHNVIFDTIFLFISGIGTAGFVWLVIILALFIWEEIKDRQGFYALLLALMTSYLTTEVIIKNMFRRPRPYFTMPNMIEIGGISSSFSFFSGHATIAFAAAHVLSYHHRKGRWFYYILAFLIAFSRIYLGKHYPSDVAVGIILGLMIGNICTKITDFAGKKVKKTS